MLNGIAGFTSSPLQAAAQNSLLQNRCASSSTTLTQVEPQADAGRKQPTLDINPNEAHGRPQGPVENRGLPLDGLFTSRKTREFNDVLEWSWNGAYSTSSGVQQERMLVPWADIIQIESINFPPHGVDR